jgi:hypothetical protein
MGILQDLKDKVMGTEKQNKEASERMKKEDAKSPDTTQAKVNKVVGYKKGGKVKKMAFGGLSGALSNATNNATNAIASTRSTPVGLGALGSGPNQSRPGRGPGLGALGRGGPGVGGMAMKKGGSVKSSASKRADGIAVKGKTRGKIV